MGILHMPQRIKQDVAPASDPLLIARAMLRDAIAAHREAERVHTALEAADLTTLDRVTAARLAVEAAEVALASAQAAETEHAINSLIGDAAAAPQSVREARAALQFAEDDLRLARATRAALQQRTTLTVLDIKAEVERRDAAALAVLRLAPAALALADRVAALQREMADLGAALLWATDHRIVDTEGKPGDAPWQAGTPAVAMVARHRLESPSTTWKALISDVPGDRPWRQAFEALKQDAQAPLPA